MVFLFYAKNKFGNHIFTTNYLLEKNEFKGKKISIGASGMGCPSIGIYAYELYDFYKVNGLANLMVLEMFFAKRRMMVLSNNPQILGVI